MSNLRLLKFYVPESFGVPLTTSEVYIDQGLEYLPKNLRYLHWHGNHPLRTLPSSVKLKIFIELNLPLRRKNGVIY